MRQLAANPPCVVPFGNLNQTAAVGEVAGVRRVEFPNTFLTQHNVFIDWGDGTFNVFPGDQIVYPHAYSAVGVYRATYLDVGVINATGSGDARACSTEIHFVVTVVPLTAQIGDVVQPEGDTNSAFTFEVSLATRVSVPVRLNYETVNGSATSPPDFAAAAGSLTFDPFQTRSQIQIPVVGDNRVEPDEQFSVLLTNPVNTAISKALGTGTILNDDVGPTASFTVQMHPGGLAELDATLSTPGEPQAPIAEYRWNFGDGHNAVTSQPRSTHAFDEPREFDVTLVVVDVFGNESTPVSKRVHYCRPDSPAISAIEYAGLVRCVEAAFPDLGPRSILSMMRQFYYGEPGSWATNQQLGWSQIIRCGQPLQDPRPLLRSTYSANFVEALRIAQTTVFEADVGHVFTGAEALACPTKTVDFSLVPNLAPRMWTVNMPNYAMATWGGDVGSAAGLRASDEIFGVSRDLSHYLGPTGIRADYADFSGDVDSFAFSHFYHGSACSEPRSALGWSNGTLSSALRGYYRPLSISRLNRVQCFAAVMGTNLRADAGGRTSFIASHKSMVDDFAEIYVLRIGAFLNAVDGRGKRIVSQNAELTTAAFFDWLVTRG